MKLWSYLVLLFIAASINSCSYICYTAFENHTSENIKITFNLVNNKFNVNESLNCHVIHVDSNLPTKNSYNYKLQIHRINDHMIDFEIPAKTTYSFHSLNSFFQGIYMSDTLELTIGDDITSKYLFYGQRLHRINENKLTMDLIRKGGLFLKNKYRLIIQNAN